MSSAIRAKFIEHMELSGLSKHTQKSYITGVKGLAQYHNQSPEKLTNDQVRLYFQHLILERKLSWSSCGPYLSGIMYFYRHLCEREVDDRFGLPARVRSKKLLSVLSMEEVSRLLCCAGNLKHRVLLQTIYSAGLRVSEAVRLMPEHIESDPSRMMIRIEQGKGQKDRYTVLSVRLLYELRDYWRKYSPEQWLFLGQNPDSHISTTTVSWVLYRAKKKLA
jgi:integrase/recombinase XerD